MKDSKLERELGSIEAEASMERWETFIDFGTHHIKHQIQDSSRSYKLHLAFEELLSNIIRAASSDEEPGATPVMLEITALERSDNDSDWFILRTRDTGVPFDPHFESRSGVDTEQPVSEREIGGLGLFLIVQSVDRVTYQWLGERNVYELCTQRSATADRPRA